MGELKSLLLKFIEIWLCVTGITRTFISAKMFLSFPIFLWIHVKLVFFSVKLPQGSRFCKTLSNSFISVEPFPLKPLRLTERAGLPSGIHTINSSNTAWGILDNSTHNRGSCGIPGAANRRQGVRRKRLITWPLC